MASAIAIRMMSINASSHPKSDAGGRASTPRPKWRPFSSPLTRRILAVNLLAPIILVIGLMYQDNYKAGLVRTGLLGLVTQAEMIAGAVGEGAIADDNFDDFGINHEVAQQMVRRLAEPAHVRARLYDVTGALIGDSRFMLSLRGMIQIEPMPEIYHSDFENWFEHFWDGITTWMPHDKSLPPYIEHMVQNARDYPETVAALAGRTSGVVRSRHHGIVLSVAVPVERYHRVVGAVLLTADGSTVAKSLFEVRVAIIEIFAVVLLITTMLSLYLASTIAKPIRHLAAAADFVRNRRGRRLHFPTFAARHDEIGDLFVSFKEMTEALWARMDAIEAFAADVAHEIKNPLTSVRSAVETVLRIHDPDQQRRLLAIIQDDVERLNRLISDISDASRIDAELSRADMERVEMASMLSALTEVYRVTTEESGLRYDLDIPANDALVVMGIESRLVQVIRNLMANAASFSPEGGRIALRGWREPGLVCLSISDDGPGIPDGKEEAIFDRFYSERPYGEKFGTHSGLGLSISKQIITAHGGLIVAKNRLTADGVKCGACFTVRLPAGA